jgi:hypothetical protein
VDIEAGALGAAEGDLAGDLAGVVKLRVALGPVGALKVAGPRGGDRTYGERSRVSGARTGERSRGVDLAESRCDTGDGSRVRFVGVGRSLCGRDGLKDVLAGWPGGELRRELSPEVRPEDFSTAGGGEGDRLRQVRDAGPLVTLPRPGLRDLALQSPLGPVGGDLLLGKGDRARAAGRLSYGDLDRDLLLMNS